ncbi:FAD-binding oxidoreductase [Streptomyces sp. SAJ15]|uniref:FAD-binding oxidoreductase n=1 Tax=Streptomyces sp. SAJ15 TaxID=2011095 RepID=UPI00118678E4|nr:FAD-binding oxidoreductase [Streptomyces sp. SAJ15]
MSATSEQVAAAVADWTRSLGEDGVVTDPQAIARTVENTSRFRVRQVVAVLTPRTTEQVQALVRTAREHRVPLYPYSTGRNWGMGSKMPVRDGCALVDLGRLDAIREVDERYHYAVVEPGVTQRRLSAYLRERGLRLQLNVTGSTPDSSVVGNLVERGTGFRNHRTEDLRGAEVVLGTGELLRTGFWAEAKQPRETHHYRYGIGPHLDGLFTQSGLGLMTAAVVNLIPVQEETRMLMFSFAETELSRVMDRISELYKDGTLRWITHVFNDKRVLTMTSEERVATWTGIGAVDGSLAQVEFTSGQIRAALEECGARVAFVDREAAFAEDADPMVRGMYRLHTGEPDTVFMEGLYHTLGSESGIEGEVTELDELDHSRFGMLACLPIFPLEGEQVTEAMGIVERVCARHGLVAAVALNPIDSTCAESVINVYFDRTDEEAAGRAQRCVRTLHRELYAAGFRFYRVDIENMGQLAELDPELWAGADALKAAFDPDHIIAPGRYSRL